MTTDLARGSIPTWTQQDRLRKAREHAGLAQAELAKTIGISRRSVTNYETGHQSPRRPVLLSWALACGVPLDWLTDEVTIESRINTSRSPISDLGSVAVVEPCTMSKITHDSREKVIEIYPFIERRKRERRSSPAPIAVGA